MNFLKKRWVLSVICFWNYRLQKGELLKCLKIPKPEHLWAVNMLRGQKHCLNQYGSILSYFIISMKKNQLEKFSLSSIWNLETVRLHIDTRWKVFSLSKSECLTQPIQMQLSPNQKLFSEFFSPFPKSN